MWNMTLINQRKPWIRDVDIATDYPRKRTSSLNLVHLVWPLCGQRESLQIARPQNCVSQIFTRRGWRGRGWSNWKIIGLLCSPEECSPFLWVWYVCAKDLKRSWGWIFDSKAKANHQPGARKRNFHLPLLLMLNLAVEHKWSATWLTVWRRVEISRLPLFPDDSKVNGICLGRLCFFFYLFFFSLRRMPLGTKGMLGHSSDLVSPDRLDSVMMRGSLEETPEVGVEKTRLDDSTSATPPFLAGESPSTGAGTPSLSQMSQESGNSDDRTGSWTGAMRHLTKPCGLSETVGFVWQSVFLGRFINALVLALWWVTLWKIPENNTSWGLFPNPCLPDCWTISLLLLQVELGRLAWFS